MAGNCGQIPMFSLMPEASYDDGILDYEIIDTSGGLIGWANLFGDVLHQTITGKAQQSPLSTNSTVDQVQGVSAEITLESLFWRRWMAICCLKRSTSVSVWNVRPYACACQGPLPSRHTGVEREYVGYANETAADRTGKRAAGRTVERLGTVRNARNGLLNIGRYRKLSRPADSLRWSRAPHAGQDRRFRLRKVGTKTHLHHHGKLPCALANLRI